MMELLKKVNKLKCQPRNIKLQHQFHDELADCLLKKREKKSMEKLISGSTKLSKMPPN
jgi:hypothetical protein